MELATHLRIDLGGGHVVMMNLLGYIQDYSGRFGEIVKELSGTKGPEYQRLLDDLFAKYGVEFEGYTAGGGKPIGYPLPGPLLAVFPASHKTACVMTMTMRALTGGASEDVDPRELLRLHVPGFLERVERAQASAINDASDGTPKTGANSAPSEGQR